MASIEDGLRGSRYVAVLVTQSFLGREWPEREMRAAFSREVRTAIAVVVPILAVDPDMFFDRHPLLADKLYLPWSDGLDVIASRISRRFDRQPAPEWFCDYPQEYVGPVWMRVNAAGGPDYLLTLRWGPYLRHVECTGLGADPVSFTFHKVQADAQTLHVSVNPAAMVTFGQGAPPDPPGISIDEGWERAAGWTFPGQ